MKLVKEHTVFSEVVTDQEAVKAVERFVGRYNPHPEQMHTRSKMTKKSPMRLISLGTSSFCRCRRRFMIWVIASLKTTGLILIFILVMSIQDKYPSVYTQI